MVTCPHLELGTPSYDSSLTMVHQSIPNSLESKYPNLLHGEMIKKLENILV